MQNFLIFDENKSIMEKQLISSSEKIRQANEVQVTLSFHQKLHRAKLAIGKVTKNANNPHFKKSYADLNAIIEAVEPILLENGLLLLQPIQGNSVCTQIIDIDSGTMVESCMELPAGLNPQQQGSAITYYRRYTLQSTLSLQSVDDDGAAASKSTPTKPPISNERLADAITAIEKGTYSLDKLKDQFSLTKEQEAKL
jgi:anti-sigma28 factor (negative regulator of flagellin synthesis)